MDESGETSKLFNKVATSLSLTKILTKIINSKFSTQEVMSDERNLQSSDDEIASMLEKEWDSLKQAQPIDESVRHQIFVKIESRIGLKQYTIRRFGRNIWKKTMEF